MSLAIRVENLGKKYLLRHQVGRSRHRYVALRDVLAYKIKSLFQSRGADGDQSREEFWALKNVSFEIQQGDAVGIIGRNGAGKSTLLKLLSRITEPSEGQIELEGRMASLLEVGTGFHPELTARENIYLNGAIMGMTRAEIKRKFDEIVAFAEVEKFLDTPVKHFSSGMYMRLAFAVAAHLEPEILVVDEVLAVGDAAFQKKCLGKMREVSRTQGRTVLFVSHNMPAIQNLCTRGVLLKQGRVVIDSDVKSCIREYELGNQANPMSEWRQTKPLSSTNLGFESISSKLIGRQPAIKLRLECRFYGHGGHRPAIIAFDIMDSLGATIMQSLPSAEPFITPQNSKNNFNFEIELPPLVPGEYRVTAWIGPHNLETFDAVIDGIAFEIQESPSPGRTFPHTPDHGFIVPNTSIEMKNI